MVKKQQKTAAPPSGKGRRKDAASAPAPAMAADTPFAEQVKASAQQIWSAGLAAFAKAQDQGEVVLGKITDDVGARAGQHWDKLESIFEDRVARALVRIGMPAAAELARLKAQVEALSAELALLRAVKSAPAETSAAKTPAAKKPATKKPAAKQAAPARQPVASKPATKTTSAKPVVAKPKAAPKRAKRTA